MRSFPFGKYVIFFRYQPDTFDVINKLLGSRDIDAFFADKVTED